MEDPLVADILPPPVFVHVALPGEYVTVTSSPTPILVRVRLAGEVAFVFELILHFNVLHFFFEDFVDFVPLLVLLGFSDVLQPDKKGILIILTKRFHCLIKITHHF
jgi:hypothetical protein